MANKDKDGRKKTRIGIVGGGPSALFMYKALIACGRSDITIDIFERKAQLGAGMPYSSAGANNEHVTNVSDNEIPHIVTSIAEWVQTAPKEILQRFCIDPDKFSEYRVLPRLFFGAYLSAQFDLLQNMAKEAGIATKVHFNTAVTDIVYAPGKIEVQAEVTDSLHHTFDAVVICTGHYWPVKHEGIVPGYYDSPYPPAKLAQTFNHTVAVRGASLTAIDAIRTLARHHGNFIKDDNGSLSYHPNDANADFKVLMHSRNGMLPGLRFHLQDSHLSKKSLLSTAQVNEHIAANNGFLSLDFIFEKDFKEIFREKDVDFYNLIKDMQLEDFVAYTMELRERLEPFQLFRAEYAEAEKSIRRKQSVYWKELLAILSFALNYPAKHLSAEDMQRLQKVLMPLISIVIAFVPQNSACELLAMHAAGVLDIVAVGADSDVQIRNEDAIVYQYVDEQGQEQARQYKTFIDCIGQPHLSYHQFPFKSLIEGEVVSPARLKFQSNEAGKLHLAGGNDMVETYNGEYYLKVPGIAINDNFQVLDNAGAANNRLYVMAVPYIGGFNPDYSGLDFCEAASGKISKALFSI